MKAKDIMRRDPIVAQAGDPLHLARSAMMWLQVRHLPVLREGRLVGVLSERDILAYGARSRAQDWLSAPVDEAMQRDAETAGPEDSITELAGRMAASKIGCLVITELGNVVGIVTSTDVLGAQVFMALESGDRSRLTVKDAMTPDPAAVHPDDRVLDAAARMQQLHIRHLLVEDGEGHLVGMLSDRDVRRAVGNPIEAMSDQPSRVRVASMRVSDVMSDQVQTASPEQPVSELARFFVQRAIGAVPVVESGGRTVGILSYIDVIRALAG